jgi:hypothetical protein
MRRLFALSVVSSCFLLSTTADSYGCTSGSTCSDPPASVTGFAASHQNEIAWSAPPNLADAEIEYRVYRGIGVQAPRVLRFRTRSSSGEGGSFNDRSIAPGRAYFYNVTATVCPPGEGDSDDGDSEEGDSACDALGESDPATVEVDRRPFCSNEDCTSPFNRMVPTSPTASQLYTDASGIPALNSATLISRFISDYPPWPSGDSPASIADSTPAGPNSGAGRPVIYSDDSDPLYTIHCVTCPPGLDGKQIHFPTALAQPYANDVDRHMAVVDDDGREFDFDAVSCVTPPDVSCGDPNTIMATFAGSGRVDDQGLHRGGGTAPRWSVLAGVIRLAELQSGHIPHALAIVVPHIDPTHFEYPADQTDGDCDPPSAPDTTTTCLRIGMRLRLNITEDEIKAGDFPAWKQAILRAFRDYGAFVADSGGTTQWSFESEGGQGYMAFGLPDPWLDFMEHNGVTFDGGTTWFLNVRDGVNWSKLQVLEPCVSRGTCGQRHRRSRKKGHRHHDQEHWRHHRRKHSHHHASVHSRSRDR